MNLVQSDNIDAAALQREESPTVRFAWPFPPAAGALAPMPMGDNETCEIVGTNNQNVVGRLVSFSPTEGVVQVQLSPMRRAVSLRFDQFRMLKLANPLPLPPGVSANVLAAASVPFDATWKDGGGIRGKTLGRHEESYGIFLYLPIEGQSAVGRLFLPRKSFAQVNVDSDPSRGGANASAAPGQETIDFHDLMSTEVTTPEELLTQLQLQSRMPIVRIGQALTSLGMITDEQLSAALAQQKLDRNVPLGETLVRMGAVTRADLQVALARKMGYPLVNLQLFPADVEALRKVAHEVARRLQVMPLMIHDGRLIVAIDDPVNRHSTLDEIEFIAQMKVVPVLAKYQDLDGVQHRAYEKIGGVQGGRGGASPEDALRTIEFDLADKSELLETLEKEGTSALAEDKPIEQSDNSLVRLINSMISEAHREGVSDIHIESYPGREKIRIRFRRDGRLYTYLELPPNYRSALIARVKIMCDLDISERRKPQDGKINFSKFSPQHKIELRVATIPTANGLEDVVMRILASAKPIPLDKLGMSPHNLEALKTAVERPYGMVLCVGPTGSGKTTTLHSALMHINTPERKIWTAEDPVEITQQGLRQVQVNPRIDWTFAKALRAFVRADPDVIMVGEIRDEETAKTAIEASLTGHLVLSTLHTNSAPDTVTRLLDMGMDPFNFADSLLAVLAQRLVRRLCSQCITSRPATDEQVEELLDDYVHSFAPEDAPAQREKVHADWLRDHSLNGKIQLYSCKGCKTCDGSGYKGRVGIHELMVMSRALRRLVQTGARAEELQAMALREGMRTLRQDGISKVLSGQTTIDEVRATSNV